MAYPGVKFSVRKRHTDRVTVSWIDGRKEDEIKAIVCKYKDVHYNSMEDLHEYCATPFNKVFCGVGYFFTERAFSDVLTEKAIQKFKAKYGVRFENINIERYKSGQLWREDFGDFWHGHGVQTEINRMRAELAA